MERTCGVQWAEKYPTFFKDDDRELARALELSRMEERHRNMAPVEVHALPWWLVPLASSSGK